VIRAPARRLLDRARGRTLRGMWGRALLLVVCLAGTAGCASDPEPVATTQEPGCEGRGEPVAVGISKESADGLMIAEITAATPLPPNVGDNAWTIELKTDTGDEVTGAGVAARWEMIDHAHPPETQAAVEREPGVYEIAPIGISMPGYWEMTLSATGVEGAPANGETFLFGFCIGS